MPPGGGGFSPAPPPGPGGPPGPKPITGSPQTMAMHAMTIDPKTGLPQGERPPASTAAVASLVCGLLLCLGPITGVAAIVAGVVALRASKRDPDGVGGRTMGIVGISLGVLNFAISAVVGVIALLGMIS